MKRKVKKLVSIITSISLVFALTACGGGSTPTAVEENTDANAFSESEVEAKTPSDLEKFKIGICEPQSVDEVVIRRNYLENYIAPYYNVEFIFSEQIKDTDAEITFIENCADAGCDGIISFRSVDAEQMARICQDYGMLYSVNSARSVKEVEACYTGGYESFIGCFGSDQLAIGDLYSDWLIENASEDGSEGFLITSSMAFQGNTQHSEITMSVLEVLQDLYDINFEDTIENIAVTSAPIEVANDKGINIYIYPGSSSSDAGWLPGVSTALQTGKYGVFIQSGQTFAQTGVIVDEVERAFDTNIKVASVGAIGETLTTAFNTNDIMGNPSIDMVTIKMLSLLSAMCFAQMYNSLTGYETCNYMSSGDKLELLFQFAMVNSPEELAELSKWDTAEGKNWIADYDIVDSMLGINNPELTGDEIQEFVYGITIDKVIAGTYKEGIE